MRKINWRDVGTRCGKTFVQAFIASIGINQISAITDADSAKTILSSMLVGGLAAGISAAWNVGLNCILKESEDE